MHVDPFVFESGWHLGDATFKSENKRDKYRIEYGRKDELVGRQSLDPGIMPAKPLEAAAAGGGNMRKSVPNHTWRVGPTRMEPVAKKSVRVASNQT